MRKTSKSQTDFSRKAVNMLAADGWPWAVLLILACIDIAVLMLTGLSLSPSAMDFYLLQAAQAVIALILSKRLVSERLQLLFRGYAFLSIAWPVLRLFNHLTAAAAFPLIDAQLLAIDRSLGFDWYAYLGWLDNHPALLQVMSFTYSGLTGFVCAVFLILLCVEAPADRCRELLNIFVYTALLSMTIGALIPAVGMMPAHAPDILPFRFIDGSVGTYAFEITRALREDAGHVINPLVMPGLVTFPSFHTAMGVIAIYCARVRLVLLAPSLAFNLTMIASTPVFGSHYLIDVIAGAAIACAVIMFYRRSIRTPQSIAARPGPAFGDPLTSPAA